MTFEVPRSKASLKQNQFEFTLPGSKKKYQLPLLQFVSNGLRDPLVKTIAEVSEYVDAETGRPRPDMPKSLGVAISDLTQQIFDKHAPGVWEQLDQVQMQALIAEWNRQSSTSVGKSLPSAE